MPPRISSPIGLRQLALCLRPSLKPSSTSLQPLIQTAGLSRQEKKRKITLAKQNKYRWAQSQQRLAANVKRQDELKEERDVTWGDPVHGVTTPFVESFDSAGQAPLSSPPIDEDGNLLEEAHELPTSPHVLNYDLTQAELEAALAHSYALTRPLEQANREVVDPVVEERERREHEVAHANAVEALRRITTLTNAGSKARLHANIRRCVETFGRHNTDHTLDRPKKPLALGQEDLMAPVRAGPDTGSSEVQIAILTAKIRALAKGLEGHRGYKDKHNKRNLRVLCHKRQKLLRYMERKERGSGRWAHMLETLGLSAATWKKEISF